MRLAAQQGRTTLRNLARIEEVNRILEVLASIGVRTRWIPGSNDLEIVPPSGSTWAPSTSRPRAAPAPSSCSSARCCTTTTAFLLPYAGGCDLGTRTVEPHLTALRHFGLDVVATHGLYEATVRPDRRRPGRSCSPSAATPSPRTPCMAAARHDGATVIRNASPNYMVQDLCFFLVRLGVRIDGIGTTTLTVHGLDDIDVDVEYSPSEDPIEAMSLLAAAVVTGSEITIRRVPIEFMEIELATLEGMGMEYRPLDEYRSANGHTRLVDLTTEPGPLHAPIDKIHPMPFPGLNIDNLPFFALIGAVAEGSTLIHDWVYDNRAIYLTELDEGRRQGPAARPAPGAHRGPDPLARRRGDVPAGPATGRRGAAGHARGAGYVGAAQRLRHQPRLRGPRRPAQRPGRDHRGLPRHLSRSGPAGRRPSNRQKPSTRRDTPSGIPRHAVPPWLLPVRRAASPPEMASRSAYVAHLA